MAEEGRCVISSFQSVPLTTKTWGKVLVPDRKPADRRARTSFPAVLCQSSYYQRRIPKTNKQRSPIQPFHTISLGNCCWSILVKTWTMSCNIWPKHKVYKKITARRFSKKFKKILKAADLNSIKKIPNPVTKPIALTEELADKQYRCLHPKPAAEMFHLLPLALNWDKIAQFLCYSDHLLESCKKTQWLWRTA